MTPPNEEKRRQFHMNLLDFIEQQELETSEVLEGLLSVVVLMAQNGAVNQLDAGAWLHEALTKIFEHYLTQQSQSTH